LDHALETSRHPYVRSLVDLLTQACATCGPDAAFVAAAATDFLCRYLAEEDLDGNVATACIRCLMESRVVEEFLDCSSRPMSFQSVGDMSK
jgi:hypothetical protein